MDKKTASWFAYLLSILSAIIVLVTVKDDKQVRTHAWQSLFLGAVYWVLVIILSIISGIAWAAAGGWSALWLGPIPVGVTIVSVISWLLALAFLAVTVICILKATQDNIFKIPVIYQQAEKMK